MKLLGIEAATDACSCALLIDAHMREEFHVAPRRHAELLLPMVETLMNQAGLRLADLDGIAVGRGPGSFTGVRIAVGVAQGLAFGGDLPVVPVSTLRTLAQGAYRELDAKRVLAAFDARMREVYWGAFERDAAGVMQAVSEECVCAPCDVPLPSGDGWHGVGAGWAAYERQLDQRLGRAVGERSTDMHVHARDLLAIAVGAVREGRVCAAEDALPVYLRTRVAHRAAPRPAGKPA